MALSLATMPLAESILRDAPSCHYSTRCARTDPQIARVSVKFYRELTVAQPVNSKSIFRTAWAGTVPVKKFTEKI